MTTERKSGDHSAGETMVTRYFRSWRAHHHALDLVGALRGFRKILRVQKRNHCRVDEVADEVA